MIVVADTGPLHYLVMIDRDWLLPALYGSVVTPPAVVSELSHASVPEVVRAASLAELA
jgi:predicted nucleic acid-binding protein